MFLIDTNIISYWMRGDANIIEKIKKHKPFEFSIATITLAEILYGIERSKIKKKERSYKLECICSQLDIHPFDIQAAKKYGIIRSYLESHGIPISERDLQIASIAFAKDLILITHNIKEFTRIPNLTVRDWAIS